MSITLQAALQGNQSTDHIAEKNQRQEYEKRSSKSMENKDCFP